MLFPLFYGRTPTKQPSAKVFGVLRIRNDELAKSSWIALRDSRLRADHRRYAARYGFLHVESIGFVSNRAHQKVSRGEHLINPGGKPQHPYSIAETGLRNQRVPTFASPSTAGSHQVGVPGWLMAERFPCGKEDVEALVAVVAEKPDEHYQRPTQGKPEALPSNRALHCCGGRAVRLDSQIDGAHPLRV